MKASILTRWAKLLATLAYQQELYDRYHDW
jgi:hypothetical protein